MESCAIDQAQGGVWDVFCGGVVAGMAVAHRVSALAQQYSSDSTSLQDAMCAPEPTGKEWNDTSCCSSFVKHVAGTRCSTRCPTSISNTTEHMATIHCWQGRGPAGSVAMGNGSCVGRWSQS